MFSRWYSYQNFWRDVRPGLTIEMTTRDGSVFGVILEKERHRLVVQPDQALPPLGDAVIRMATHKSLLRANARISVCSSRPTTTVVLDRFERPERCERRRHPRLHEPVTVTIQPRTPTEVERSVPAVNISGQGALLGWPDGPQAVLGELLDLTICLDPDWCVRAVAEVIRVNKHQTAVRFQQISPEDQDAIVGHIFRREAERYGSNL